MKVNSLFIILISLVSIIIVITPFVFAYYRFTQPQDIYTTTNSPGSKLMLNEVIQKNSILGESDEAEFVIVSEPQQTQDNKSTSSQINQQDSILSPMLIFTVVGIVLVGIGLFF